MGSVRLFALAGVSMMSLATPAFAQNKPADASAADNSADIVVMARRREERLQDVPKVVNAVGADDLRKNNIQKFDEVASIVPGISLQNSGNGLVQNAAMRGVSFDVDAGLPSPTVQFYLNDANIQANWVFQSMYDIGQIEVLRGPQGTLRGRSSPSGSITLTTKLPDLYTIGGYGEVTVESAIAGRKENYALNIPLIKGKLAVRIAGTVDDSDGNAIRNLNSSLYPDRGFNRTWSERVSVRAEPVDSVEINLTYQRLVNRAVSNLQTESICLIDPSQPCSATTSGGFPVTGPSTVISPGDRLSTVNGQRSVYQNEDIWNGRVDWHVLGQKLSYVGQYALQTLTDEEPQDGANWFNSDLNTTAPSSAFAGTANPYQKYALARAQFQSHEVRLANETLIANLFDYVVGFNTVDQETDVSVQLGNDYPQSILPGTIGYIGRNGNTEVSWFGNLTAHPTEKLEVSGGARYIIDKSINTPSALAGGGGSTVRTSHTIWTASVSYHFTPSVMAYANAGSSFRPGGTNQGLQDQPASYGAAPLSNLPQFFNIQPETSTSYEVGFKSQFLNRHLTINADYYHQDFHDFQYISTDYLYVMGITGPTTTLLIPPVALGTANVPAKVDGVEADVNYRFAPEGNIGGSFSYSYGRITGGALVPCPGSIATLSATNQVNTCPGSATSNNPRFNASLHADYARPLTDSVTGFVRGQTSIFGATPNNSAISPYDKVKSYALVNLYAGVRAPDTKWELTLFVKNVFDNKTRLQTYGGNFNASTGERAFAPFGPQTLVMSNYAYISTPLPREFGLTLRYAFGSR